MLRLGCPHATSLREDRRQGERVPSPDWLGEGKGARSLQQELEGHCVHAATEPSVRLSGAQLVGLAKLRERPGDGSRSFPSRCRPNFLSIFLASSDVGATGCLKLLHSGSVIWTSMGGRLGALHSELPCVVSPHHIQPWTRV